MVYERSDVSGLLPDDLCADVLEDPRTVLTRLDMGSNKVFDRLADSPHARISLPCCSEELDDFGSERRRVEQKPAFIENGDARLACFSTGTGGDSIRNQHAHSCFELRIGAQSFHSEEEPTAVEPHGGVRDEKLCVNPT